MSNLTKRVLIALIGIPVIIGAAYQGGVSFLIFSIIVSSLALWEFCSMFERKGFTPMKYYGVMVSILLMIAFSFNTPDLAYPALIILFPVISIPEIFRKDKNPVNPLLLLSGMSYIVFPFILLNILSSSVNSNIVICVFILIWACDSAAYFGGRYFGRHQLSVISPGKTREGSVAGFIFTIMISFLIHFIFPGIMTLADAAAIGIIIGIFAQAGDLFESLLKRYCDIKDSSDIIPGHGGVLDRFDSLIFVTPFIFLYMLLIK